MQEEYSNRIVTKPTKEVNRVMKVLDRLVKSNKDIYEIRNVKWTITFVDVPYDNAAAYPVRNVLNFIDKIVCF